MLQNTNTENIEVNVNVEFNRVKPDTGRLKKLVRVVCRRFELCRGIVDITVADDKTIRRLNKRHLGRDSSTDCLSFNLSQPAKKLPGSYETGGPSGKNEFDIIVNGELALTESQKRNHKPEAELALYITHGLLHNLGFDDQEPVFAEKMHQTEDEILQEFGYGKVYSS